LLLGHFSARAGFFGQDALEIGILTFISAYKIQQLFLDASSKTFTPRTTKPALFSSLNFAMISSPYAFVQDYPNVRDDLVLKLTPNGVPILHRKSEERLVRDRWEDCSS
jgi:hypothetical protein